MTKSLLACFWIGVSQELSGGDERAEIRVYGTFSDAAFVAFHHSGVVARTNEKAQRFPPLTPPRLPRS